MFYLLFSVVQFAIGGIAAWTLHEVIVQGKEIARIEQTLNIDPLSTALRHGAKEIAHE